MCAHMPVMFPYKIKCQTYWNYAAAGRAPLGYSNQIVDGRARPSMCCASSNPRYSRMSRNGTTARTLRRTRRDATLASTNQVTEDAAGYTTPAQTEVTVMQPPALPVPAPTPTQTEAEIAAALTALQSQQQNGDNAADGSLQRRSPRATGRSCVGCGTVVTTKWTPLGAGFVCGRCITALPQSRQRRPPTAAEMAAATNSYI